MAVPKAALFGAVLLLVVAGGDVFNAFQQSAGKSGQKPMSGVDAQSAQANQADDKSTVRVEKPMLVEALQSGLHISFCTS